MSRKLIAALVNHLKPTGSSQSQIVKSLVWIGSQNAIGRVLLLVMLVILARLIGPTEIGLVGIALITMRGLKRFTKIGLNEALIYQKEDNVDSYLDTVWLLEIGRGFLIGGCMFALAPLIASVFGEPRAEPLLQVTAIAPVLIGFKNPGIVYFDKNLDFHKQFAYEIGSNVIRFVVSIGFALVEPTAWAYIAGFLAADVTRFVLSYVIDDFRPWFRFEREAAAELINYGKWVTGSSILNFLNTEGDDAFVGWLLGPVALGLYQYAYRFSNAPATEITQVVSRVMFPAFSKIQDDTEHLRGVFLTTLRMTAFVSFPASFGIAAVAPSFVRAFLGPDWTDMILAMQILAVYGLLRALGMTFGPVWKAVGRPDYNAKLAVLRLLLTFAIIYPLSTRYGIAGTAFAVTVVYVVPMMPLDVHIIKGTVEASYRQILSEVVYPLVAGAVMFGGVWMLHLSLDIAPIFEFFLLTAVGIVLYALSVLVLELQFDWGIKQNLDTLIANVKN